MAFTITIINGNSDPTFVGTKQLTLADLAVISPTGITTPQTPYVEWVSDTTAQLDGAVQIPAWKRSGTQYFILPASSKVAFDVESADEALFYRNMIGKFENVTITVTTDPVTEYTISGLAYGSGDTLNKVAVDGTASATAPTGTDLELVTGTATYTSSDTSIVTVAADGTITGKKAGSATVTYTAKFTIDGTDSVIEASDSVKITVTES